MYMRCWMQSAMSKYYFSCTGCLLLLLRSRDCLGWCNYLSISVSKSLCKQAKWGPEWDRGLANRLWNEVDAVGHSFLFSKWKATKYCINTHSIRFQIKAEVSRLCLFKCLRSNILELKRVKHHPQSLSDKLKYFLTNHPPDSVPRLREPI